MIKCKFYNKNDTYNCEISDQVFSFEVIEKTFKGSHKLFYKNDNVQFLWIFQSKFPYSVPNGLGEVFKYITQLSIISSGLTTISMKNLKQFPYLENLDLSHNEIKEIPINLFEFNKDLKIILLNQNSIAIIKSGLLEGLKKLEEFCMEKNQLKFIPGDFLKFNKKIMKISFRDNDIKFIGHELLDGLQDLKYVNFDRVFDFGLNYDKENDDPDKLYEVIEEIKSLKMPMEIYQDYVNSLRKPHQNSSGSLQNDIMDFLTFDTFKDFTVKINKKLFKIHKFLFMARSEFFSEFVKNNPDAKEMIIEDIPDEIFEAILNFLYTDEFSLATYLQVDDRKIFYAASKLKIKKLKEIFAKSLIEELKSMTKLSEVWVIFNFGVLCNHDEMKLKAFEELKKYFPPDTLADELIENPEMVKKIVETKLLANLFLEEDLRSNNNLGNIELFKK